MAYVLSPEIARAAERIAFRRWQAALSARAAVDRFDDRWPALDDEVRRLERIWAKRWKANI